MTAKTVKAEATSSKSQSSQPNIVVAVAAEYLVSTKALIESVVGLLLAVRSRAVA